ncbi:ParB/RepB/Spo0J family partition protein [Streptomyces canus]|uniref:ParB/RepB/Spo0J family partition protein n=1 Tax=Streptomyces canus TaxID=58343 RepID=UPI002787FC4E|nr:ParB N-terminal domain-containing protein [Streptomyces canus]MDQ0762844.1 ParB-like chromosome segregation protein Spo0J [Streptomyces canus]
MTELAPRTQKGPIVPRSEPVAIAALVPADSPRSGEVDLAYARSLMEVRELPPILVCRRTMRVIDGMHRLTAATLAGRADIDVRYFDGDEKEAFVQAVQANLHRGRRLSQQERAAAARRIVAAYPQWSNRAIAQAAGLSTKTVAAIRRRSTGNEPQLNSRVGRDGRARPVDPSVGRERAAAHLREHPDASLRQIAEAAGISVGTARDVRARVERGEDPVGRRAAVRDERVLLTAVERNNRLRVPDPRPAVAPVKDPLAVLTRDPSLRFSEAGRQLLRLLDNRALLDAGGDALSAAVPLHNRAALTAAVYQHIDTWLAFLSMLERAG